ncbi:RidA family protein [Paraburkholderia diazotrophica]|uniref:Enamine deaminase RidA, house cleaning of reactive enamine intermediates, YjgF/YER057c/UK114 family n=1 Tax=Paraburkholderia diazotrophica TaxID=667676 RepID=A0A1H7EJ06_9BURK|nr:RidA family protein [Paraburkholderia diazotrophica]SEK13936.1 Enamine deaminase RidA, house cleaning of reactive enamine intermediates, YjgF/YER057c/UK114 family [Paraburkholderia diazotrophica]
MSNETKRFLDTGRLSQVVVANGVVHLAGQVSDGPGDAVAIQTQKILARIDELLSLAGVDKTRLLTANVWLSDREYFDEFNAVWDSWVAKGHSPTRACVQSLLMAPGYDVEVSVTALST